VPTPIAISGCEPSAPSTPLDLPRCRPPAPKNQLGLGNYASVPRFWLPTTKFSFASRFSHLSLGLGSRCEISGLGLRESPLPAIFTKEPMPHSHLWFCSVFCSNCSNRTCSFPASGTHLRLLDSRIRLADAAPWQLEQAESFIEKFVAILAISRTPLVAAPPQPSLARVVRTIRPPRVHLAGVSSHCAITESNYPSDIRWLRLFINEPQMKFPSSKIISDEFSECQNARPMGRRNQESVLPTVPRSVLPHTS